MKFLVFVLILWVVYLVLRTWVNRGGGHRSRGRAWHDNGYLSGPVDSYANPHASRDPDDDCRRDHTDSSDNSGGGDCGGGDSGGSSSD